jgi:hypothetical protein
MKRGFLNKSGNKKIPPSSTTHDLVSNLAEPTSIAAAVPHVPPKGIIPIPTGPIKDFRASAPLENALANWPGLKAGVTFVTTSLPPSQGHPDVHSFCLLPPGIKEKVLALPNFPGPPFMVSMMQNKFRIGPVPGAGKGMFVTTDLKAGDLIMAERPLLVAPAAFPYANLKGFVHPDKIMEMAVNERLGPNGRDIFMQLHNCKGPDTPKIRGIVDTNSLELGPMPGHDTQYMGIFQHISRINHRSVTAPPFL